MAQPADDLLRLEEILRRPDFILEPRAWDTVLRYIKAKGRPESIIELLSENYVGYAQMAVVVCNWLQLVQDTPGQANDECHYLKEFVKAKFDSDKFTEVFSSGAHNKLTWLDGLLSEPRGRQVIYELSSQHPNSLLLNYAIHKIMKLGHQDEVASMGTALASYFTVFHKLLANRLRGVIAAMSSAAQQQAAGNAAAAVVSASGELNPELEALLKELQDSCQHSQHTYMHVQHLLHYFACQPGGAALQAVAHRLEARLAAAQPSLPLWGMQRLYAPCGSSPAYLEACLLVGRVLQQAAGSGPPGAGGGGGEQHAARADTLRLHELYAGQQAAPAEGCGLDVGPLQHPRLIQHLLACMFTPSRPPTAELQSACAMLLARATCSPAGHQHPDGGGAAADDAGRKPAAAVAARVECTCHALLAAAQMLEYAKQHGRLTEEHELESREMRKLPVVCQGLLHYAGQALASPECYQDATGQAQVPALLRVLLLVATGQPHMAPQVVSLLGVALPELQRAGCLDHCRMALDVGAALMAARECCAVRQVVGVVEAWARSADAALVKYWVFQVLGTFAPPYPQELVFALLRLMVLAGIRGSNQRSAAALGLLREFAQSLEGPQMAGLSPREVALLAELRAEQPRA